MNTTADVAKKRNVVERLFHLDELDTTFRRELLAGLTTFMTMSYILFVNANILSDAGMDKGAVFVATALTAIVGCLLMAFLANYPVAVAPAMGDNAFFAYSVVIGMGIAWQTALAAVFVASILFSIITLTSLRRLVIEAIPRDLKLAMAAGIGIFIAFVGLQGSGLIIGNEATMVTIGPITSQTWLTIFGFFVTIVLIIRNFTGAIFFGMAATSILGLATGLIPLPAQIVSTIPSLKPIFAVGLLHIAEVNTLQLASVVIMILFVAFFNTTGTLVGLAEQAGFVKNNKIPGVGKALTSDSSAMLAGSIFGSTPACAYVESSSGIAVGGRTGLTALVVAVLFFLSLFFSPLLGVITSHVTAPILVVVGILMATTLKDINWQTFESAVPAFLIIVSMPLTFNVAYGIGFGFIAYPITMIAAGKWKQVKPLMYCLAILFVLVFYVLNSLG